MAQPGPAPGTVIEVNGLRFAKAPRRSIDKLQGINPLPGFDGWFKAGVSGVLLMRSNGEPFAFASANDCAACRPSFPALLRDGGRHGTEQDPGPVAASHQPPTVHSGHPSAGNQVRRCRPRR